MRCRRSAFIVACGDVESGGGGGGGGSVTRGGVWCGDMAIGPIFIVIVLYIASFF